MNNQREVTIYGRLGKNPELRITKKEKPFCIFTLAERVKGEEAPRWHNIVMWGKEAEHWSSVLHKGTSVFVRGRIVDREYKSDSGELKLYTEVNADAIGFTN